MLAVLKDTAVAMEGAMKDKNVVKFLVHINRVLKCRYIEQCMGSAYKVCTETDTSLHTRALASTRVSGTRTS